MKNDSKYHAPAVFGGDDIVFAVPALLATGVAAVAVGWAARAMRGDNIVEKSIAGLEPCLEA
ncbi:MAG: hypothetical protein IJT58_02320 [Synergistaceae bacterium]|nr:hypothetical protein [Synergistaceae bacterium]